jgi:hypothetical protein
MGIREPGTDQQLSYTRQVQHSQSKQQDFALQERHRYGRLLSPDLEIAVVLPLL